MGDLVRDTPSCELLETLAQRRGECRALLCRVVDGRPSVWLIRSSIDEDFIAQSRGNRGLQLVQVCGAPQINVTFR